MAGWIPLFVNKWSTRCQKKQYLLLNKFSLDAFNGHQGEFDGGSKSQVTGQVRSQVRGLFLESPETFRAHFGWHKFHCIFKTKASWGTKLHSYFHCYSLYNIWKDQRYRINRSEFYEWLFGPEKFSGLSRNGPQVRSKGRIFFCQGDWLYFSGILFYQRSW